MCFATCDLLSSQAMAQFQILRQQHSCSLKFISSWYAARLLTPSQREKIIYSTKYAKSKEFALSAVGRKQKQATTLKPADRD